MKVKCLSNKIIDVPNHVYEKLHGYTSKTVYVELDLNKEFVVYSVMTIDGIFWYLIDSGLTYPMYYPCHLFEIIDKRLSKYWIIKDIRHNTNSIDIMLGFTEIVNDIFFYSELIEDKVDNISIFEKYKNLIDSEY